MISPKIIIGAKCSERQEKGQSDRCCEVHGCPLSQESQKPSTTAWISNGVYGSIKIGVLQMFQKGAFLELLVSGCCAQIAIFAKLGSCAEAVTR